MSTDNWITLSVPHRGNPTAATFYGQDDFLARHYAAADQARCGKCVYVKTTARELARDQGTTPEDIAAFAAKIDDAFLVEILTLGGKHGWDTPLYRADYLHAEGEYGPEPTDEVEAVSAWAGDDLSAWYLCRTSAEVTELLERLEVNGPRIGQCGPVAAAAALRREAGIKPVYEEGEDEAED